LEKWNGSEIAGADVDFDRLKAALKRRTP